MRRMDVILPDPKDDNLRRRDVDMRRTDFVQPYPKDEDLQRQDTDMRQRKTG